MHILVCKRCIDYDVCFKNEFKHPLNSMPLPVIGFIASETIKLYNLMKIGIKFNYNDMMNMSNKIISLLQIFTSEINERNARALKEKNKGE